LNSVKARHWILVSFVLFLFFLMESSLLPWLIPTEWRSELLVYPKLVLAGIIFISLFKNRRVGLVYGLAFGLLQDVIFYGHMIGVNSFTYGLSAYMAGLWIRPNQIGIFAVFILQLSALLLYETSTYALYRLFSIYDADFAWVFINGMLPSMLISLFLALALYIPTRRWLEAPISERDTDEE
jgi:rod shape-determining protein MreD